MPIDYDKFDLTTQVFTGGVTGSTKVKNNDDGSYYQLKPSILSNTFVRRTKANGVDRENFGEVIASKIAQEISRNIDYKLVPDVSLSYNPDNKQTSIASKYLSGKSVNDLRKYALNLLNIKSDKNSNKVIFKRTTSSNLAKNELDISGDDNRSLREGISRSIAISILLGDHDINPGNMLIVDGNVSRIDFGHAFNDLLNAPKMFGGRVRNKDNLALDFFNRSDVAHLIPSGRFSKLWRYYPDMVPSKEMIDALNQMSDPTYLKKGLDSAKSEFIDLIKETEEKENNNPKNYKKVHKHIIASLEEINRAIDGQPAPKNSSINSKIDHVFKNLGNFCKKTQDQMRDAAKLMKLQVELDNLITDTYKGSPTPQDKIKDIKKTYEELTKIKGIGNSKSSKITWIKSSENKPAFYGNLSDYIKSKGAQIGLSDDKIKTLLNDDFKLPKQKSFFENFIGLLSSIFKSNNISVGYNLNESIKQNDKNQIMGPAGKIDKTIDLEKTSSSNSTKPIPKKNIFQQKILAEKGQDIYDSQNSSRTKNKLSFSEKINKQTHSSDKQK